MSIRAVVSSYTQRRAILRVHRRRQACRSWLSLSISTSHRSWQSHCVGKMACASVNSLLCQRQRAQTCDPGPLSSALLQQKQPHCHQYPNGRLDRARDLHRCDKSGCLPPFCCQLGAHYAWCSLHQQGEFLQVGKLSEHRYRYHYAWPTRPCSVEPAYNYAIEDWIDNHVPSRQRVSLPPHRPSPFAYGAD